MLISLNKSDSRRINLYILKRSLIIDHMIVGVSKLKPGTIPSLHDEIITGLHILFRHSNMLKLIFTPPWIDCMMSSNVLTWCLLNKGFSASLGICHWPLSSDFSAFSIIPSQQYFLTVGSETFHFCKNAANWGASSNLLCKSQCQVQVSDWFNIFLCCWRHEERVSDF